MESFKSLFASKTFWGAALGGVAALLGLLGYTFGPEDVEQAAVALSSVGAIVGTIVAIIGRIVASKKIGKAS